MAISIESLLAARLFFNPKRVNVAYFPTFTTVLVLSDRGGCYARCKPKNTSC